MSRLKKTLLFFTPFHHLGRAADQIKETRQNLKDIASEVKQAQKDKAGKYPEGDIRNEQDPHKRFDLMYELHGWTEDELLTQRKACRRGRITCVIMTIIVLISLLAMAPQLSAIWAVLFMPAVGCLLILCFSQAFRYALYELQLEQRAFIGWRELGSRSDLFKRMFRF